MKGYTIIEVLMAIVIMTICIFIIFYFFHVISSTNIWKDGELLELIDNTMNKVIINSDKNIDNIYKRDKWTIKVKKETIDGLSTIKIDIFYRDKIKPYFEINTLRINTFSDSIIAKE